MEYMHEGILPLDKTHLIESDNYPNLLNELMEYITEVKTNNRELTLVDVIINYAIKNNISVELIGDAIRDDTYFKQFLQSEIDAKKENFDW